MTPEKIERTRYRLAGTVPAVELVDGQGEFADHAFQGGDTVFADPRVRRRFRGVEVVEVDWEGRLFLVRSDVFARSARPVLSGA